MNKLTDTLARYMSLVCTLIIVLMPFHAFLTVWGSSIFGHYTLLRLWKEILLLVLVLAGIILLTMQRRSRRLLLRDKLFWLLCAYVLLLVVAGGIALAAGTVNRKAFAYGLLLDSRFLAFFCVVWLATAHNDILLRFWKKILLIPAAITVGFALLQYAALPADFLKHFGYGPRTILPTETVDQNIAYRRVQSTLRGANPFGAYLVLIVSALGMLLTGTRRRRLPATLFFALSGLALFFTFSRSAWLGTLVATALLLWLTIRSRKVRQGLLIAGCAAVVAFGAVTYALRNNEHFAKVVFHTSSSSRSAESSNAGHVSALKGGLKDIAHRPWGSGVGTAGPASVYNKTPARIAENYYVQIAQETGLEGLCIFAAITILIGMRLWRRRSHELALVLLVSLVGLTVVNMLLHGWTDDTLAYVWWGLAGAAMNLAPGSGGKHEMAE